VDKSGAIKGYDADGIGAETSTPLYLLVDGRTASAAEIFAAALQDNQRGIVVGSKTFGKGRIQNVQPLDNGSGLAITRARYITPKGRDLHGIGIIPNKEPSHCGQDDSARTCLADIV
jgi:carboxyl-terminal processing protease